MSRAGQSVVLTDCMRCFLVYFDLTFFVFIGSIHQPELGEDDADMIYMNKGALLVWLCVLSVISVASVVCLVVLLIKKEDNS